jgi:flavin-dependent dehydrogenase
VIRKTTLVVLGAGPAGSSAAIWAARCGVETVLLDCFSAAKQKPGETLHPGIEPLLERLGARREVLTAGFIRHDGYWVERDGRRTFSAYGADAGIPWRGFQANRQQFDAILLRAAADSGVQVLRLVRARQPLISNGRVAGLELGEAVIRSRFVIDAGGGSHWLARRLRLLVCNLSHKLTAQFGYTLRPVLGDAADPVFRWERGAWTWAAPVGNGEHAIVHLDLSGGRAAPDFGFPIQFRGANVTWRVVEECAGPGYFLAGDAAGVLDPATSHGVLRAIMSGMLAADLIAQISRRQASESHAAAAYRSSISDWFQKDATRLRELYAQMGWPSATPAAHLLASAPWQ